MTNEEMVDSFEESLKRLKTFYDLFFSGARKLPPLEDRRRLDAAAHELAALKLRENGLRFRFNTLLGRYNMFKELWGRLMREREEGPSDYRKRKAGMMAEPAPAPPEEKVAARPVTSQPSESYVKVNSEGSSMAMQEIFQQIATANAQLGKAAIPLEQVTAMVQKQLELLRGRYSTKTFGFRVDTSEGKVKLKAKPIQES